MRKNLVGFVLGMLLCCTARAQAQYAVLHPNNLGRLTAELQYIHSYDAEKETLQLDDIREVTETVAKSEVDPATGITRMIPAEDTRQIIERRTFRLADLRALSPKGEALKLTEILAKLKPDHPVIVIAKGHQKLPAAYQKLMRDDVIVLEIPVPEVRAGLPAGAFAAPGAVLPRGAIPGFVPADTRPGFTAPPSLPFAPAPPPSGDDRF